MVKSFRPILIIVLLVLVAAGLNISNQGMNSLTGQSRPAVIGAQTGKDYVTVTALGQNHYWTKEKFILGINNMVLSARDHLADARDYLLKIWRIFRVLAFY